MQKSRLQGLKLNLLYSTHRYYEAEKIADILSNEKNLPWEAAYALAEFYIRTLRFDDAQDIIDRIRIPASFRKNALKSWTAIIAAIRSAMKKKVVATYPVKAKI